LLVKSEKDMQAANWANASASVTGAGPASTGAPASAVPPDELPLLLPPLPELDAVPLLEPPELPPVLLLAALPLLLPLLAVFPGRYSPVWPVPVGSPLPHPA
jgi:hypothetical protein